MTVKKQISPVWITIFKFLLPIIAGGIGSLFYLLIEIRSNQIIIQKDVTEIKNKLEKHDNSIVDIRVQDGRYDELLNQILTSKH
jgi:hypothetical protein